MSPSLPEAHQIGVGLGRRHAGFARQVLQRHRPAVVHQRQQQLAADLDALDAALGGAVGLAGAAQVVSCWRVTGVAHGIVRSLQRD
jgi:hypothetical protein